MTLAHILPRLIEALLASVLAGPFGERLAPLLGRVFGRARVMGAMRRVEARLRAELQGLAALHERGRVVARLRAPGRLVRRLLAGLRKRMTARVPRPSSFATLLGTFTLPVAACSAAPDLAPP